MTMLSAYFMSHDTSTPFVDFVRSRHTVKPLYPAKGFRSQSDAPDHMS